MEGHFPVVAAPDIDAADIGMMQRAALARRVHLIGDDRDIGGRLIEALARELEIAPALALLDHADDLLLRHASGHLGEGYDAAFVEMGAVEFRIARPEFLLEGKEIVFDRHEAPPLRG